MSRLFQDALKANKDAQVFTGDPTFIGTSEQGNIATTEQTKAVIEQFYSYYSSTITYQQIATNGVFNTSMIFDTVGNLYFAVCNYYNGTTPNLTSYVYKITPSGSLTTFASVATNGARGTDLKFDASGNLYWAITNYTNASTNNLTSYVYKITPAGTLTTLVSVATNGAYGTSLIFDSSDNLYWAVCNFYNGTYFLTSRIYKITSNGTMTTFASAVGNGATSTDLKFDTIGNLYWAITNQEFSATYTQTSYVYKITPAGSMTTFASVVTTGGSGTSLVFDASGNLYWAVTNWFNGTTYNLTSYVYKITPAGSMTTFSSVATIGAVRTSLISDSNGNMYWAVSNYYNATTYNLTSFVYKIGLNGSLTTFASNLSTGAQGCSLASDVFGNLYLTNGSYYNGTTYNLNSYIYRFNKLTAN